MATGSVPPPHSDCSFISEGSVMPPRTQPVGNPYQRPCKIKLRCVNRQNLLDWIYVYCDGKQQCQDKHHDEEVIYECPNCKAGSNCPCAGTQYHRIPTAGSTTADCKECVPDNVCGCPDGYMS